MELSPIAPSPLEVVYAVGTTVVAVVFAAYAIWKMAKREWPIRFGLALILCTCVVPFSGPVIVALRAPRTRQAFGAPARRV